MLTAYNAITQGIDWHWIFWINVPIGAVALPLPLRLLPDSHGAPERLDLLGVTLLTGSVVAIVWALGTPASVTDGFRPRCRAARPAARTSRGSRRS